MTSKSELKRLAALDPIGTAEKLAIAIEALEWICSCEARMDDSFHATYSNRWRLKDAVRTARVALGRVTK